MKESNFLYLGDAGGAEVSKGRARVGGVPESETCFEVLERQIDVEYWSFEQSGVVGLYYLANRTILNISRNVPAAEVVLVSSLFRR